MSAGYNSRTFGYFGDSTSGGVATNVPISGLTAAIATNSISNGSYEQVWDWPSLSAATALTLSASGNTGTDNTVLKVLSEGTSGGGGSSVNYGIFCAVNKVPGVPSSSKNIAGYFSATSGDLNYAIVVPSGSGMVGIGIAAPLSILHVVGNSIFAPTVTTGTGSSAGMQIVANSLTTGNGVDISSSSATTGNLVKITCTSTAAGSNTLTGLAIAMSGANGTVSQTVTGQTISVTNTGTTNTNVGLTITASGASTNYALKLVDGSQGLSKVLTSDANGNASWATPSAPSLTATQIAFGDGSNLMTGSSGFIYNPTQRFIVKFSGNIGLSADPDNQEWIFGDYAGAFGHGNTFYLNNNASQAFYDNTAHTGFFGINTSNPSVALDVIGACHIDGGGVPNIQIGDNSGAGNNISLSFGGDAWSLGDGNGAGNSYITGDVFAGTIRLNTITGVGINTTPSVALDVVGDVKTVGTDPTTGFSTDGLYTYMGDYAGVGSSTYISIRDGASRITLSNNIVFSSYGAGAITSDASGNLTSVSDERLKTNIKPYKTGLKELLLVKPIQYQWNEKSKMETVGTYAGFSAQNVRASIPFGTGENKDGYLSLQDRALLATAFNAIQELSAKVDNLEAENKKLRNKQ